MNSTQIGTFEAIAKEFIQWNMDHSVSEGDVDLTSVTLLSQKVIMDDHSHNRKLSASGLEVEISTVGDYSSLVHPEEFDFEMTIRNGFESNFALFRSNLLDTGDKYFVPLDPTVIPKSIQEGSDDESLSKGAYAAIIFVSILISLMAIAVSFYAIRKKKEEKLKGDKLSEMNMYDDPVGSNLTQDSVGPTLKNSKSIEIIKVSDSPEKSPEEEDQHQETSSHNIEIDTAPGATPSKEDFTEVISVDQLNPGMTREQIMSPNTMEKGRMGALAESILRNESFGSSRDPPESSGRFSSYGGPKSKGDPTARYNRPENHPSIPRPDSIPSKRVSAIELLI